MSNPTNLLAIEVRFIGPTNTKGCRVRLRLMGQRRIRVIPYAYELRDSEDVARKWLESNGVSVHARCMGPQQSSFLLCQFTQAENLHNLFS